MFGDRVLRGRGKVHGAELDAGSKLSVLEGDTNGLQSRSVQKKASPVPGRLGALAVHEAQPLEFLDSAVARGDRDSEPAAEVDRGRRVVEGPWRMRAEYPSMIVWVTCKASIVPTPS